MFSLGLRLLFQSGREALWRLLAIVAGVVLGTVLLFSILSGFTGVNEYDTRSAWQDTKGQEYKRGEVPDTGLLWNANADVFDGQTMKRFDVAANGSDLAIPGIPKLPGPGEYYVSPALAELIREHPADQLADRFGSRQVGVIGKEGVGSANELVAVVGHTKELLGQVSGTKVVSAINDQPNPGRSQFLRIILAVGAVAVLFPAVMCVAVATRLAAARREERFAAIRLVGGTRRQVMGLAIIETLVGSLLGVVFGYLFFLFVPHIITHFEFVGVQFYAEYLYLTPLQILLAAGGVVSGSVIASLVALRRVDISPLGVARKATPKPPRIWRLIPLAIGILATLYITMWGGPVNELTMIGAFLLVGFGLFMAGPWVTAKIAWMLQRFAPGASMLIASSRLLKRPTAIFKAVSGVVIAIFAVSTFNAIITSYVNTNDTQRMLLPESTLVVMMPVHADVIKAAAEELEQRLAAPSVSNVIPFYEVPSNMTLDKIALDTLEGPEVVTPDLLVSCHDAKQLEITTCAGDSQFVAVSSQILYNKQSVGTQWQVVTREQGELTPSPWILVETDGTVAGRERARTEIEKVAGVEALAATSSETYGEGTRLFRQLTQLMNVGIFVTLLVAGCSLLIAVADSLLERKRPFTLLRLTGMSLRQLRWTVMLEAAIPLVIVSLLSVGIGTAFGGLLLYATTGVMVSMPGWPFMLTIALGIVLSLAVVACTLPLLNKLTRSENAKFE